MGRRIGLFHQLKLVTRNIAHICSVHIKFTQTFKENKIVKYVKKSGKKKKL